MGVSGLWSLLSSAGKEVNLEDCKGKKLAIDFSAWVVQCSSVATSKPIPESYLCCRGIFMRTLNLLSLGISLVFVIDGPNPPALKKNVKNREKFYRVAMEYKELLTALGVPVIECDGEAEKMCAELSHRGLVDGVITNDGDALIYGAKTVYKGLFQEREDHIATVYSMEDIAADLNLNNRDLVAFALLSKGDFCDGVPQVGEKKFVELMKELKSNDIEDALDRLRTWASNAELDALDSKNKSLKINKKTHCGQCQHEGTKQKHKSSGCAVCQTESDCREGTTPGHPSCLCEYHIMDREVGQYKTELKLRELALKSNRLFPDQAVIQEFLEPLPQTLEIDLSLHMPNFQDVCRIIEQRLHYDITQTMSYLVPTIIKMAFHSLLPDLTITPLRIVRTCKHNFKQCFKIEWQRLDQDEFSDESSYTFQLSQNLFSSRYPEMVDQFMSTSTSTVKRKFKNSEQPKITSHFKIVKQPDSQK